VGEETPSEQEQPQFLRFKKKNQGRVKFSELGSTGGNSGVWGVLYIAKNKSKEKGDEGGGEGEKCQREEGLGQRGMRPCERERSI